jgi:hypothetical protein
MTLIDESDEFVVLVSPYIKILKWHKLVKKIENLKHRKIPHVLVIRDDKIKNPDSFYELDSLGVHYEAIKDLHCKLYLNEKYAIVSSMNLLLSSEINAIELAYQTETKEEYQELIEFCNRHLKIDVKTYFDAAPEIENSIDWRELLDQRLSEAIGRPAKIVQNAEALTISTMRNKYSASIWSEKGNRLQVSGILTQREYDALKFNPRLFPKISGFRLEVVDGGNKHYNTIWGTLDRTLNTKSLDRADPSESDLLAESVANFVLEVDEFKMSL